MSLPSRRVDRRLDRARTQIKQEEEAESARQRKKAKDREIKDENE